MSVIWLQWREPTHDLCVLVELKDVGIESTCYAAGVDIAVAERDRVCICGLGHDVLSESKKLVGCINGMMEEYVELIGEITRLSVGRAGEKRGDVACFVATT